MPSATLSAPVTPEILIEGPQRKRFTRDEVERMLDAGVFEGQRCELIDGDLIDKMGQKPPHSFPIRLLAEWLAGLFGMKRVQIQLPIEAAPEDRDRSWPEPDLAVLAEFKDEYRRRDPQGKELLLVVEVSDTTRAFDLGRKAVLYARSGVPEYWVLDVNRRMLVVHRKPDGEQYRLVQMVSEEEMVSMEGRADTVKVGDLLPARD